MRRDDPNPDESHLTSASMELWRNFGQVDHRMNATWQFPSQFANPIADVLPGIKQHLSHPASQGKHPNPAVSLNPLPITMGDFVQHKFVPGYVATKKSAGQTHFRAILKYVLSPELVAQAFGLDVGAPRSPRRENSGVLYLDSYLLTDITPDVIQNLMSSYLNLGYSAQTVTHIRNLLRTIFVYAADAGCHTGANPATLVTSPNIIRHQVNSLTLPQLVHALQLMQYPEREIAICALLTGLNVTEICGLQWKYVNLSVGGRPVDGEWLPPRTIAVRTQSYRGVVGQVNSRRKRLIQVCALLNIMLRDLLRRHRFTAAEDFVLSSRSGTPINPDNIALRRLKRIGIALGMPWLSWKVFRQTRTNLVAQFGKQWSDAIAEYPPFKHP